MRRTYSLTLAPERSRRRPGSRVKQPMHIPVRFGLVGPNGDDLGLDGVSGGGVDGDVIHLTKPEQTFVFPGVSARPIPSLLRGFSAPVKLVDRPFARRPPVPASHRRRRLQPLAGRADALPMPR